MPYCAKCAGCWQADACVSEASPCGSLVRGGLLSTHAQSTRRRAEPSRSDRTSPGVGGSRHRMQFSAPCLSEKAVVQTARSTSSRLNEYDRISQHVAAASCVACMKHVCAVAHGICSTGWPRTTRIFEPRLLVRTVALASVCCVGLPFRGREFPT